MSSYLDEIFGLSGKTAVVIGGGGVLGGTMAEGLARAGARVAVISRSAENAEKQSGRLQQLGAESLAIQADASVRSDVLRIQKTVQERWGRLDILINAAAINSATPFLQIPEEEWTRILDVNLKSVFLACQIFGESLIRQGRGGSIINISSASSGPPLSRVFTYGISKAGVNNLTQFLAREWAPHRIRVNALVPGFFPAEQNRTILTAERREAIFRHTPLSRFGEAHELMGAMLWLASEKASSFVTGALVRVDGGFSAVTI